MSSANATSYRDLDVTFTLADKSGPQKATVHYVEAGNPSNPTILLLHGYPASSHQYRNLIPLLSDRYHVLAPDYPGFGLTKVAEDFPFTFENITTVTAALLSALNVTRTAIFIQDFGAPVGFRLATTVPSLHITAIVSQNGNLYTEGLGPNFQPLVKFWESQNSEEWRTKIRNNVLTLAGTRERYTMGTPERDMHLIDPEAWTLAHLQNIAGPANQEHQLSFLYDYRTNVDLYPAWQKWVRESKVPILAVWGKGDPSFIYPGAEAFRRDSPEAEIHLLDAGHFALESKLDEIAGLTREFLGRVLVKGA